MNGTDLKRGRRALGLSMRKLSSEIGISRTSLTVYESDEKPVPKKVALAMEALTARMK